MRKTALLLPIVGIFAYLTLTSSSGGRSGNLTTSGCGSCHGNSATTGITVSFSLDSAGTTVTKYKAGKVYTLKMTGTNSTSSNLSFFGYHMVAVMGSGSTQAGTFGTLPSGTSQHSSGSLTVLGHNMPISPASGTGASGTTYTVSVPWTAPAAGSGTVTVRAALNAVNGDGNDGSSDHWNTGSGTFAELPTTTGVNEAVAAAVSVYPNPVSTNLNIELGTEESEVAVYDLSGKLMAIETNVSGKLSVNAAVWAAGIYQVVVKTNSGTKTVSVAKQ